MTFSVRPFRRLQWQLGRSYTLVAVGTLLVVELLLIGAMLVELGKLFPNASLGIGEIGAQNETDGFPAPTYSEKVRIATARALGNTGRSKARVHLEHQRRVETSDAVKDAISAALTAVPTSD